MQGGRKKLQFPTNISLYTVARKRLKIDGYTRYAAMPLTGIESSFHPCNYHECPRSVPRGFQNVP